MTFPIRFLICNLFIAMLLVLLLIIKQLFRKHLTLNAQYGLWYVFAASLILPFLPCRIFSSEKLFLLISQLFRSGPAKQVSAASGSAEKAARTTDIWIHDFSTAVASASSPWFIRILWGIWIAGGCLVALYFTYNILRIYLLRKRAYLITAQTEPELYRQYKNCLKELHIRHPLTLYASCSISSPVSYGLLKPKIIIPQDLDILMTEEDIRYIFLHELQHYKHKDALLNSLSCILQIVYWFNPFIWYGFRQMQKDRELACDNAVMDIIGSRHCAQYGFTLLRYAETMRTGIFLSPLSNMGDTKKTMQQRITAIVNYQKPSVRQKIRSAVLTAFAVSIVICSSPLFTVSAFSDPALHLTGSNWSPLDAASYFGSHNGTFVLYDMTSGEYQIYNKKMSEQRVSPDSTYKIYSGLIALEEKLITPDSTVQKWDGTHHVYGAWNHDHTLITAMQNSVNWYFKNLDRRAGLPALYSYYRKFSYGNCDLTGGIENYWAESSLKISPVEQVNALAALLKNEWHLKPQNIQAIKDSLFLSETSVGKLYGKTGTGEVNGQNCNGWFVGFLEHGDHIYCFATNLRDQSDADGSTAAKITVNILNDFL